MPPGLRILADRNNELCGRRDKIEELVTFAGSDKSREFVLDGGESGR